MQHDMTLSRPFARPRSRLSVLRMFETWRQRQALARLDARALADIGLSRAEAAREAARPFWDLG